MPEISGLQIEARCVKCGKLPTAEITLFEMQNHLYICNICAQQAEMQGKQIAWVNNLQAAALSASMPALSASKQQSSSATTEIPRGKSSLPADSVFALLDLSLDTPIAKIKEAIRQRMRTLMRDPDQREMVAQLRSWQEKLQDEAKFEAYRASLKPAPRESGALSVGGKLVWTIDEFLAACESSAEGWADGERYLRTGQLSQWILFQQNNRELALSIRKYQAWNGVSDFRALNAALYVLVPERPFRFYAEECWEPLAQVLSATTPEELANICDKNWQLGESHLYEGDMRYWLETSRGITGLIDYYTKSIEGYAQRAQDRGVGLELMLERAIPTLPKPRLEVSFDGQVGECVIERWDREIPHKPVTVKITNTTRGYTNFHLRLQREQTVGLPDWLALNVTPSQYFWGRPGAGMPLCRTLTLNTLSWNRQPLLSPGKTYQYALKLYQVREYATAQGVQEYPITLKTLHSWQGLRGILWRWGLRGGFPGLGWNFIAGLILNYLVFQVCGKLALSSYLHWSPSTVKVASFASITSALLTGIVQSINTFGNNLTLAVAILFGIAGFWTGIGKGHTTYPAGQNARGFRKGMAWLLLLLVPCMMIQDQSGQRFAMSFNKAGTPWPFAVLCFNLRDLIIGILVFLLACIMAAIHSHLENYLRARYVQLLNPDGRA